MDSSGSGGSLTEAVANGPSDSSSSDSTLLIVMIFIAVVSVLVFGCAVGMLYFVRRKVLKEDDADDAEEERRRRMKTELELQQHRLRLSQIHQVHRVQSNHGSGHYLMQPQQQVQQQVVNNSNSNLMTGSSREFQPIVNFGNPTFPPSDFGIDGVASELQHGGAVQRADNDPRPLPSTSPRRDSASGLSVPPPGSLGQQPTQAFLSSSNIVLDNSSTAKPIQHSALTSNSASVIQQHPPPPTSLLHRAPSEEGGPRRESLSTVDNSLHEEAADASVFSEMTSRASAHQGGDGGGDGDENISLPQHTATNALSVVVPVQRTQSGGPCREPVLQHHRITGNLIGFPPQQQHPTILEEGEGDSGEGSSSMSHGGGKPPLSGSRSDSSQIAGHVPVNRKPGAPGGPLLQQLRNDLLKDEPLEASGRSGGAPKSPLLLQPQLDESSPTQRGRSPGPMTTPPMTPKRNGNSLIPRPASQGGSQHVDPMTTTNSGANPVGASQNGVGGGVGLGGSLNQSNLLGASLEMDSQTQKKLEEISRMIEQRKFRKTKVLKKDVDQSLVIYSCLLDNCQTITMKEVILGTEDMFFDELMQLYHLVREEVALVKTLHHRNIAQVYDCALEEEERKAYVFSEMVGGGSLASMVRSMPGFLPETAAKQFVLQICRALAYCHDMGVIHRDLKGANILLDEEGKIKLTGFSMAVKPAIRGQVQSIVGTPYFIAPEVLVAAAYDQSSPSLPAGGYGQKADVWSLGITISEIMSKGEIPWPVFANSGQAFMHIGQLGVVPQFPEHLSNLCKDFLRKCCRRAPQDRPTILELMKHPWLAKM